MAAKGTIGGKIVLEGEKEYNQALKNIRQNQKELSAEMKLANAQFRDSQNGVDALEKKYDILGRQVKSQADKVETYKKALESSQNAQQRAADKVETYKKALEEAVKKQKQMSDSSDTTSEAMEEQNKAVSELEKKLKLAQSDYDSITGKVSKYNTALNEAEAELLNMNANLDKTGKYLDEAKKSTDGCARSIDEFGKETDDASQKTNVFGDVLKANLASELVLDGLEKLVEGIKEVAVAATDTGSSFEASMSQVAATMGMTAEEVNSGCEAYTLLSDTAKECGKATMFSASEAGEALNYLALAGYDAEKAAATLPKVLDLAAAGGLDLAYASDLVTDSMAALSMETEQLDMYIDEMARTSQKSNTSVAQLGEATLVCAGTVSLTGQSIETMNTELGILANNGIKGAEGGTHLRNILLSLSAPTDVAADAMKSLGIKISDSQGNMRDMSDIIADLGASLSGMADVEKTAMISAIFNKTDIAAVNALIKGTGEEYNNLYAEIENCSGAAANMAETLNNNLKGKVTILQSALEGLGISAYEIFDDEMKRSVESATDAVGRLQGSMDSGDLGVSMRKFSQSLGELVEGAIDFGEKALPVAIDGLTWMIDNSEILISGIVGLTAATKGAAVAQEIYNAVVNANPAALAMKAIIGLAAAMAAFAVTADTDSIALSETAQRTKELTEASRELNASYSTASAERKANRESMEVEAATCNKLVQELEKIQSKTELTVEEQARQKAIIDQLNQAMPELNLALDEQTGMLNMSTRELERNVDALMAQAKAEAAREDLTRIAEEQYEAEKQLAELEEQLEEQTFKVNEAQQEYTDTINKFNDTALGYTAAMDAMGGAGSEYAEKLENEKQAQADLQEQISATQETIASCTDEYANTLDYISDTEPVDNAAAAISGMGDAAAGAGENFTVFSDSVIEKMEDMSENLSETLNSQMSLFDEFDKKTTVSKDILLSNMQSQIDGVTEWSNNLKTLAKNGIDEGLLQTLADMGPEGSAYVSAFVEMTTDELDKASELYRESLTVKDDAVSDITSAWGQLAQDSIDGYLQGIEENKEEIEKETEGLGEDAVEGFAKGQDSHSPSKKFEEQAKNSVEGYKQGVISNKNAAILVINNMANEILRTSQNELSASKFAEIGKQIPAGLVQGINSGKSGVVNAIQKMCEDAVQSAKKTLDINSPSRRFEYLGEMSGDGYINGLVRSMSYVGKVIDKMVPNEINISGSVSDISGSSSGQTINQNVYVYSKQNNIIEEAREFKQMMREAALEW